MGIPKLVHDSHFVSVVPETTVKTSKTAINGIVFVCFIIFTIVFLCISKFYEVLLPQDIKIPGLIVAIHSSAMLVFKVTKSSIMLWCHKVEA